jgi:hypothetical protein
MKRILSFLILTIFLSGNFVLANQLSIPFRYAKIFEPKQNALIAWNGKEEMLSISFFMNSSEPTQILRVIPFPSEPKVELASPTVFDNAVDIINRKLTGGYREKAGEALAQFSSDKVFTLTPAGEVASYKRIGVHDIATVKLLNVDGFVEWTENYLRSKGVKDPVINDSAKKVINQYIEKGFIWFVFDAVSLEAKTRECDIVQYTFATDSLYYPLNIAKTVEGDTSINIIVITSGLLGDFTGIDPDKIKLCNPPLGLNKEEVRNIDYRLDALFNLSFKETAEIRIWNIKGKASEFEKDLLAK